MLQGAVVAAYLANVKRRRHRLANDVDELRTWIGASTYADYDARKLDRMFQESTGQTAVAASVDKIGLWLDGAQWGGKTLAGMLAGQPEKVVNSQFSTDLSGWVAGVGATIVRDTAIFPDGAMKVSSVGGAQTYAIQTITGLTSGRTYVIEAEVYTPTANGSNGAAIGIQASGFTTTGSVVQQTQDTVGKLSIQFTAVGTSQTIYASVVTLNMAGWGGTGAVGYFNFVSLKEIPGSHGLNATASQRLNLLISGGRTTAVGDGSDDNLLTTWLAASGGNTILFDVDVPASVGAGTQVFFGFQGASAGRLWLGINSNGTLGAGVGSQNSGTITGAVSHFNKRLVGALTHDGASQKLFTLVSGLEHSSPQTGAPDATVPARLQSLNVNGASSAFYSGGIARIVPIKKGGLTLADWLKIGPQFAAGASLS